MDNPLLSEFSGLFGTAPFSKIKNEHFKPAFDKAIEMAKAEIDAIVENSEEPDFKNTIEALDFSGEKLDRISSIFFNLNSAETNDEIQKIAQEVSPLLSDFSNDIRLNKALFAKVKSVFEKQETYPLTTEQRTLLEKKYKGFTRNGANLADADQKKLREIDKKLAQLSLKFGENVLAENNAYTLHIENEENLKGLPDGAVEAAKLLAEEQDKEGWIFTLDIPSYLPFMTYAEDRSLREILAKEYGKRGFQKNEFDNQKVVLDIVNLRNDRAKLLGYPTHAHFVLEERMAEKPQKVIDFLQDLLKKAKPAAEKEFEQLKELARKDQIEILQKWDGSFYSEKLKKQLFDLDEEQLKPYFKLENVIQGVFDISNKLYSLKFEEVQDIDKYHEDVKTYLVKKNGEVVSVLYADFFPRKGKRNGAWMTSYKSQWKKDGVNSRPHISIVCNFTKPTKTKPSLLTFNEVTTLFHEFGHALHGMLANTTYPSLSGTSVYWDFVELPSQVFENWCYEEDALKLFAKHYESSALIPFELIEKIKKSANFLEGLATVRQISFGLLDMAWHAKDLSDIKDVKSYEELIFAQTKFYPDVPENCMSTAFSHIFQGGYSSGYYSYKWAEVLDADAFEAFKEKGIFDKGTAEKFEKFVLSQGGTDKPMTLYKKFRGKEPDAKALLKRAGLLQN
ncbi:MAG: M3 family metallopeptidase [Lutimonas sp.]